VRFRELEITGCWEITPEPHCDSRGSFSRVFCANEFAEHGLPTHFVQANQTFTRRSGTIRGLHLQRPPFAEGKHVRCLLGAILDVMVDMRHGSPTFLQRVEVKLCAESGRMAFVPPGFAHGFQSLTDDSLVTYQSTAVYSASCELQVNYLDPLLAIRWPIPPVNVSEKDQESAFLDKNFDGVNV
jgi:dTDP-4-dehydrorhamnose 3,5-epimerase